MIKVCKFGGTSMADGINMLRIAKIVQSDPARRYVVVSAPGKRFGGDSKVTDLLYETHREVEESGSVGDSFRKVAARFERIVDELHLSFDIKGLLTETARRIERERCEEFTASRGEYLAARVMAELLNIPFLDAEEYIFFRGGRLDAARSYAALGEAMRAHERAVIPGFYGRDEEGQVRTFSRGGSDITGAVAARAAGADLYENWTDVSGFLACDPRLVSGAVGIRELSYRELRELSYMGANVMHSESIFPVREADIPIQIRNTFRPDDFGTMILPTPPQSSRTVTGIAGKEHFTVIFLEKSLMNEEIGLAAKVLSILARHKISFEHMPSGIDTMSFVIDSAYLGNGTLEKIEEEIKEAICPDKIDVIEDIALIAVVGHGMARSVGTSARLFSAIANAGVNVRMIDQGSSELNIIVGVDNCNYARTVRAVYDEFFGIK